MKAVQKQAQKGFTMVELMVVSFILFLLASIAIPSYSDYVTRSKIPQATSGLATRRIQMEQYFQDNRTYVNAPACAADSSNNYVDFTCASTATTYTLTATGKADKSLDGFVYTVNESNLQTTTISGKAPSGWHNNANCWITKKDGSC